MSWISNCSHTLFLCHKNSLSLLKRLWKKDERRGPSSMLLLKLTVLRRVWLALNLAFLSPFLLNQVYANSTSLFYSCIPSSYTILPPLSSVSDKVGLQGVSVEIADQGQVLCRKHMSEGCVCSLLLQFQQTASLPCSDTEKGFLSCCTVAGHL